MSLFAQQGSFDDLRFPDEAGVAQALNQQSVPPPPAPIAGAAQYPPNNPVAGSYSASSPMQQTRPYNLSSYPGMYNYSTYGQPMMNPYAMQRPPMAPPVKQKPKPWGDTRYIWPDFYTDFTGDVWDKMINAPYDMGYMPGGWRFPSFSSPDPVTVGDAVANQVPPVIEEIPNFMNFAN